MYDLHFAMVLHLMDMRAEEARRWAETEHMLREAGLDQRAWPSWQGHRLLLVRAGAWLVTVGQRLQLHFQPEAPSFEGKGIGGREAARS
jgi:hypothetical protein